MNEFKYEFIGNDEIKGIDKHGRQVVHIYHRNNTNYVLLNIYPYDYRTRYNFSDDDLKHDKLLKVQPLILIAYKLWWAYHDFIKETKENGTTAEC